MCDNGFARGADSLGVRFFTRRCLVFLVDVARNGDKYFAQRSVCHMILAGVFVC